MIAQSESAFKAILRKMQMKKLPLALCTVLASTAYAAPTIYGNGYTGFLYEPVTTTTTNLATNVATTTKKTGDVFQYPTINLGLRGSEDINNNLSASYKFEYRAAFDGDKTSLKPRDTYIGLKHKNYGELKIGRMYTIDNSINEAQIAYLYGQGTGLPFAYDGQRINHTVAYSSPKFNHEKTQIIAQYGMVNKDKGAQFDVRDWANKQYLKVNTDLGIVGLTHEMDKLTLGATYTQGGKNFKSLRMVASAKPNDKVSIGVLGQATDYFASSNKSTKEMGGLASISYQYSEPLSLYAQAGYSTNYGGHPDGKMTVGAVGASYKLNKNITLYGTTTGVNSTEIDHALDDKTKLYKNEKQDIKAMGVETGAVFKF